MSPSERKIDAASFDFLQEWIRIEKAFWRADGDKSLPHSISPTGIAQNRKNKIVVGVDLPGQFSRETVNFVLILIESEARDFNILTFKHRIIGPIKPNLILDDRASQAEANIILRKVTSAGLECTLAGFSREPVVGQIAKNLSGKSISS